jgi:transcriptional regulator with XRE-family HTH domain
VALTGEQLRVKRVQAGITGAVVCMRARISRSKLSEIERGLTKPTDEVLKRLEATLADLIRAKKRLAAVAEQEGWPVPIRGNSEP